MSKVGKDLIQSANEVLNGETRTFVEVIRCKDCEHYEPDNCEYGHCRMYWFNMRDIGTDGMIPMPTGADDFCSRGKRVE